MLLFLLPAVMSTILLCDHLRVQASFAWSAAGRTRQGQAEGQHGALLSGGSSRTGLADSWSSGIGMREQGLRFRTEPSLGFWQHPSLRVSQATAGLGWASPGGTAESAVQVGSADPISAISGTDTGRQSCISGLALQHRAARAALCARGSL